MLKKIKVRPGIFAPVFVDLYSTPTVAVDRKQQSLLLYLETCCVDYGGNLETCCVDYGGKIESCRMNKEDWDIIEVWKEEDLVRVERVSGKTLMDYSAKGLVTASKQTHVVWLHPIMWATSTLLRMYRAQQAFEKLQYGDLLPDKVIKLVR